MKNEKSKWYLLIAIAIIVGALVGYFATAKLSTTGGATEIYYLAEAHDLQSTAYKIVQNSYTEFGVYPVVIMFPSEDRTVKAAYQIVTTENGKFILNPIDVTKKVSAQAVLDDIYAGTCSCMKRLSYGPNPTDYAEVTTDCAPNIFGWKCRVCPYSNPDRACGAAFT